MLPFWLNLFTQLWTSSICMPRNIHRHGDTLMASETNTGTWKTQKEPFGGPFWQSSLEWIRKNQPIKLHSAIPTRPLTMTFHASELGSQNKVTELCSYCRHSWNYLCKFQRGCEPVNTNCEWWRELQQPGGEKARGLAWLDIKEKILHWFFSPHMILRQWYKEHLKACIVFCASVLHFFHVMFVSMSCTLPQKGKE